MDVQADRARYLPAEDTYLLRDALRSCAGEACLEIGFGTATVISSVSERFRLAVGTDIIGVTEAKLALSSKVDLVLSDRAKCFRDASFDLVFFNPPYLPAMKVEDRAVDGGPTGVEVPISFLEDALRVLRGDGAITVLLSDKGDLKAFAEHCEGMGLVVEQVSQKRIFYETLFVFRLKRPRPTEG